MSDDDPGLDSRRILMQPIPAGPQEDRLDPTAEWPAPREFPEEDTDPHGFTPIDPAARPPAGDPFDDPALTSACPLPGWTAPPDLAPLSGRGSRRRPLLIVAAAALLAALATAFVLVPRSAPDTRPFAGGARPATGDQALTGPRNGLTAASFAVLDSATRIELTAADLGGDLFRITSPESGGLTPSVEQDGDALRLRLRPGGSSSGGGATVAIQLSSRVRWTLRLDGGTARSTLDLTGADLAALDLNGGAGRIDLTLPEPHGIVGVRMTGGVDQFRVRLAKATPIRVRVDSGAGQVTLDGATHQGVAPGRSFTANGWGRDGTGIDLRAAAGLAALTVTS
ncbi:hypothetical protein [Actinoplanes siamensis]|uniref:Uncharacterized protein n=1 Tax=Actinoplanes siamensis TaxID=1223317 RepID=A0A919N3Q4_9ACTN|nr:hypothetical protein [Actinoplanes siamensis]GIF03779.1 hypothetical protein Asi03nite_13170 [Actinoplanes siamensis]